MVDGAAMVCAREASMAMVDEGRAASGRRGEEEERGGEAKTAMAEDPRERLSHVESEERSTTR